MGNFKIYNVKGDGSCYYRCVWQLAKEKSYIADALDVKNRIDEDIGADEVREYVSCCVRYDPKTKTYLKNLIDLYEDVPDIVAMYPLLSKIDCNDDFNKICECIAKQIEDTKMYASSFEHEIISNRFNTISYDAAVDLHIIVLTQHGGLSNDQLVEKWMNELRIMLPKIKCDDVAIFINEDNIHYKYARFFGNIVINRKELIDHIETEFTIADMVDVDYDDDSDDIL